MRETRMLIIGAALLAATNLATYALSQQEYQPCYVSYIIPAPSQL